MMQVQILGSINLDIVSEVEELPRPGETIIARRTTMGPGGKGANQAVAAARFGAVVRMHGAVGDDEDGRFLCAHLVAEGVGISAIAVRPEMRTGRANVIVSRDGQNMIVVESGANAVARFVPSVAAGPSIFLTQMETPADAAAAMFGTAHPGDLRILNTAPAMASARALFPLLDIIVLNEGEVAFYAGETANMLAGARHLLTRDDQRIIVTLGADGAIIVAPNEVTRIPGRKVQAVDTTGAGDCFVGVLAAALAAGMNLTKAAETANHAASISVQRHGANSAPSRAELAQDGGA